MAWYRTATINLTNGSAAIVGVGTDFISGVAVGEGLQAPDGKVYEIASIQSATALTLGSIYLGATSSAQPYTIVPTQSYIRDLASQAATLVNSFVAVRDSVGAGKFDKGTLALPGISFVGDSNTGIRHTTVVADGTGALAGDSFALVANGVDQATVDVNGLTVRALSVTGALSAAGVITGSNLSGTNTGDQNLSTYATLTGAQILSGKTLATPVINGFSGTGNGAMTGNLAVTGALSATGTISQSAVTGEKLLAYVSGNVKYGLNIATGQMQLYAPSNNVVNIGTMSTVDGSTFSNVASISSTGLAVTGALSATTTIETGSYTVATLPSGTVGQRAYVTDATAPTYNAALTGGGAVRIPVFKNATVWVSA